MSVSGAARHDDPAAMPAFTRDPQFALRLADMAQPLRKYARRLCNDRDLADDLVQETFLRAWRSESGFTPGSQFKAWLYAILRNAFRSHYKQARWLAALSDDRLIDSLAQKECQSATVELHQVEEAISTLPLDQRQALEMVTVGGMTYAQAAHHAHISVPSLKSRVHRARLSLSEIVN